MEADKAAEAEAEALRQKWVQAMKDGGAGSMRQQPPAEGEEEGTDVFSLD